MAGGLVGLLDDVAAIAKLAAASIDDVGAAAGKASVKAAGVIVDDTAVTPTYVQGLAAKRELPIIRRIAFGSLRNKLLIILPVAMLASAVAPKLVEVILMCGGAYLSYEGAHKVLHARSKGEHHDEPAVMAGPEAEEATIKGAIRTDLILSAEVMVIALKEVLDEHFVQRAAVLVLVAFAITILVYGVVALIVKMDDVGLAMTKRKSSGSVKVGRLLVAGMPKLLAWLTIIGTAAMLWVGGHILLAGSAELGWHAAYDLVHDLEHAMPHVSVVGGVLRWLVNTAASAVVGFVIGFVIAKIAGAVAARRHNGGEAGSAH